MASIPEPTGASYEEHDHGPAEDRQFRNHDSLPSSTNATRYRIFVHRDELVGPMFSVTDGVTGESWSLPAFSGEVDRDDAGR